MGRFWEKIDKRLVWFCLTVFGVYFFVRYFLPLVYPFLIAVFIVAPLHPFLEKIEKKTNISRSVLTTGMLLLLGGIVLLLVWLLASWCIGHLGDMAAGVDTAQAQIGSFLTDCCHYLEESVGADANYIETVVLEKVDVFIDNFQMNIMPRIMEESVYYVKGVLSIGAFIAITSIATILLAKDFDEIMEAVKKLDGAKRLLDIAGSIGRMVLTFLRAQFIIMACISVTATTGLFLAGIPGAFQLGILAGLLDALPFIGTGIVLLPTAFWQLAQGSIGKAFICLAIYACCALLREFLEPKLIGRRLGLVPVMVLASVYIGVKLYGLGGIILGPLSLLLIKEISGLYGQKQEE